MSSGSSGSAGDFPVWADRRWLRVRYTFTEEREQRISSSGGTLVVSEKARDVERMTAVCHVAGVDSQTVLGDLSSTLPTIYIPGGGTDSASSSGWTFQSPEVEDGPGPVSHVTCTWERTTEWVATGSNS